MAKLTVFLDGTKVTECTLTPGKDVVIGRGSQCDVTLDHPKISRQHLRLSYDGTDWQCLVLSKFGHIIVNSHAVQNFSLSDGIVFSILPYDIKFESHADGTSNVAEKSSAADKTFALSHTGQELSEKTRTSALELKIVLKRLNDKSETVEEIILGHETLEAGRSRETGLKLNDPVASRKHFAINYDNRNYHIKDMGSSNKTYVNDMALSDAHTLQSGDIISVGAEKFIFEIQNPEFENLPAIVHGESLPAIINQNYENNPAVIRYNPNQMTAQSPGASGWPYTTSDDSGQAGSVKRSLLSDKRFKIGLIGILLVIIIFEVTNKNERPKAGARMVASNATKMAGDGQNASFDKLSTENKKFIEETYNLALNLYTTGKYDLAALEIQKIFQLVNNYKDARNIQALCQQALEIRKQQDDAERVRREQDNLKAKVDQILDGCEAVLNAKKYNQVDGCVSQVNELDPENDRAKNLSLTAHQLAQQIASNKEAAASAVRRKSIAIKIYQKASKDYAQGHFKEAAMAFNQIQHISFNDTINLKNKARLGEQSSRAQIQKQADTWVREAKQALDAKDYGTAMQKFNKALTYSPRNPAAVDGKEQAQRELVVEMKNMYSESVIEENLGNIESAKKKWRTILKTDNRGGQYYEKARLKLQKYEK